MTAGKQLPRWPLFLIAAPAAIERYAQAFRAMCENSIREYADGVTGETPESGPLNDAVIDAKRDVPRLRRWLIARRILRELNYWNRTGGAGMSGKRAWARLRVAADAAELTDPRSSIVAAVLDRWAPIMPSVDGKVLSVLFPDDRPGSAAELDHDPRYLIGRLSQALSMLLEREMPPMDATARLLCEAIKDAIEYRRSCCPRCPAEGICERCLPGWCKASAYEWLPNELGIIDDGQDWAPRAVLRAADDPGGER